MTSVLALTNDLHSGLSLRGPSEAREPGVNEHPPHSWRTIRVHGFRVPFARFAGFGRRNDAASISMIRWSHNTSSRAFLIWAAMWLLWAGADPALACACCTNAGQRNVSVV